MGLEISYSNGFVLDKNLEVKLNKAFEVISAEEDLSQYSINIRIVNDKEMMDLNRKFRKKDSNFQEKWKWISKSLRIYKRRGKKIRFR